MAQYNHVPRTPQSMHVAYDNVSAQGTMTTNADS